MTDRIIGDLMFDKHLLPNDKASVEDLGFADVLSSYTFREAIGWLRQNSVFNLVTSRMSYRSLIQLSGDTDWKPYLTARMAEQRGFPFDFQAFGVRFLEDKDISPARNERGLYTWDVHIRTRDKEVVITHAA
jgi:hypothetical protein